MKQDRNSIQPIERPPSLHYSVQAAIKSYIIDNRLEIGDPIPSENEFSKQLKVSRNLVREAVRGLETLGIVEIRRGSGLFVGSFSLVKLLNNLNYSIHFELRELVELLVIRRVLESGMISEAIRARTPEQTKELIAIIGAIRQQAEQGEPFPEEDRRFHQCLFGQLNNRTLLQVLDSFWLALNKADQVIDIVDTDPVWTYNLHVPIVEAFVADDVAMMQVALEQHYGNLENRLQDMQEEAEKKGPLEK